MDIGEEDLSGDMKTFSYEELYGFVKNCPKKNLDTKILFMEEKVLEIVCCPETEMHIVKHSLRYFKSDFKRKWEESCRKSDRFLEKNQIWLKKIINVPTWTHKSAPKSGRPSKPFEELSDRSKRRKTHGIRSETCAEELTFAASMSQRASGNTNLSKLITEATATPTRAKKIRKSFFQKETIKKHTPFEALSHFVEADLTRKQYEVIQSANKNIYPCYSLLKKAKQECYPKKEAIRVTETCAEVHLQELLDHTSTRLCEYLKEVLENTTEEERNNFKLITKWGCDGSQQSQFKQKFENNLDSDAQIFQSSLVPIRLITKVGDIEKILWQNPVPSSPRFCRPIRIRFVQETTISTKEEKLYVDNQVKDLIKTEITTSNGVCVHVKHILMFTMIDAKICNAITDTKSTMRCYICGLTSKDFNDLSKRKEENVQAVSFGLSILHARIRFFESILHLAYKLPIKKWRLTCAEDKEIHAETKKRIQEDFKAEMGLLVDIPKAGFGNTNDGNTSRRFFQDPEISARITGIDVTLIERFKVILEALSSGHMIDVEKFSAYASETAELYVNLYKWHPMTPTVHKILVHGATVISEALLPIGYLSEEAAEARNKHFRSYRLNFTRKFSREICNRDILNRLFLTSDPLLSSLRQKSKKRSKPFSSETLQLLIPESRYVETKKTKSGSEAEDIKNIEEEKEIEFEDGSD